MIPPHLMQKRNNLEEADCIAVDVALKQHVNGYWEVIDTVRQSIRFSTNSYVLPYSTDFAKFDISLAFLCVCGRAGESIISFHLVVIPLAADYFLDLHECDG